MKAIVLNEYGDSSHLKLTRRFQSRGPGVGEIRVKVTAASINPIDWKLRAVTTRRLCFCSFHFPFVPVSTCPVRSWSWGRVTALQGRRACTPGFVSAGTHSSSSWHRKRLGLGPKGMSLEDAAVIPLAALTGAQLVEEGL